MSKIVARMEKMKTGNLGGIQRHNQRETDNHSNKEIDVTRSHLNYDLVNQESINYRERIHEIIDTQRVSKRAVRKDAVLVDEWIITSDKTFFETADSRKFFEDSVAYFSDRCGSQNIVYATVHLDETTPHMHLGIVPMHEGRLSSKQVFSRQTLKEIQDELPGYLQSQGHAIERGIKGSEQKHLTVEEYKENQREVERMTEQVRDLEYKARAINRDIKMHREYVDEVAQETWHDDWLVTKKEMPDFSMTMPAPLDNSIRVEVDQHTAKKYRMGFQQVVKLFQEKFAQVKSCIAHKWQELSRKELELEGKRESIKEREKLLETKLGRLNAEVRVKENQSDQLSELIDSKTQYIKHLTDSAQLSVALPDYVKPAKLNKDVLLVPKDKWEEKHVSANAVSNMLRIKETFSRAENRIAKQAQEGISNWELQSEKTKLQYENEFLEHEKIGFINGYVRLFNSGKISENELRGVLSEDLQKTIGLKPVQKDFGMSRDFDGPSLGL
jgi:hypothetical protein